MKAFRCYNCEDERGVPGHPFFAETPVCPKCGLDGTKPQYARHFAPMKAIHFDTPDPAFAKSKNKHGSGKAACSPDLKNVMLTNAPNVVNCPACKETDEWKDADKSFSFNPEDDFPVTIDPANMVLTKG